MYAMKRMFVLWLKKWKTSDHFDPYLVHKLDNRTVTSPSVIIEKIIKYFNKFFYLLKSSSGAYVEIYKNKYYIRKYELMGKEFARFKILLIKASIVFASLRKTFRFKKSHTLRCRISDNILVQCNGSGKCQSPAVQRRVSIHCDLVFIHF